MMNALFLKRREIITTAIPPVSAYVQDGLILHMDGIEKGESVGNWVDLVNGLVFTGYGSPIFGTDYIEFDGTDDYFKNIDFTGVAHSSGTIEIVIDNTRANTGAFVFSPKDTGIMAHLSSTGLRTKAGSNSTNGTRYIGIPDKASISATRLHGYANGVEITDTGVGYYSPSEDGSYIGARKYSDVQAFFKGKIYSIRIYNRQLTETEVLQNYAVDLQRFPFLKNI